MREIVTLEQFDGLLLLLAALGVPLGALGGLLLRRFPQGLALGLLGPLIYVAWLLFRWTVRLDPATHYVGLYRPIVLAADVALFLALGLALGLLYRRAFLTSKQEDPHGHHHDSAL
jgi:hypothetical protein